MKSRLLILVFALISIIIVFNEDKLAHNQYSSDVCGYYLYLPAVFIYHDLGDLSFYPAVDSEYHTLDLKCYPLNGKMIDKWERDD